MIVDTYASLKENEIDRVRSSFGDQLQKLKIPIVEPHIGKETESFGLSVGSQPIIASRRKRSILEDALTQYFTPTEKRKRFKNVKYSNKIMPEESDNVVYIDMDETERAVEMIDQSTQYENAKFNYTKIITAVYNITPKIYIDFFVVKHKHFPDIKYAGVVGNHVHTVGSREGYITRLSINHNYGVKFYGGEKFKTKIYNSDDIFKITLKEALSLLKGYKIKLNNEETRKNADLYDALTNAVNYLEFQLKRCGAGIEIE